MKIIRGNIVDSVKCEIFKGEIHIDGKRIHKIVRCDVAENDFVLSGFIDAHVHIESSLLIPSQFAKLAVRNGTVATVSDPHEIANVLGVEGINFMIANSKRTPLKVFFGAPSCVPATDLETSGAKINSNEVEKLLLRHDIYYLSEMMNFPGVVYDDAEVKNKLLAAQKASKPIDGHAPNLKGEMLRKYVQAGISTDHECTTIEEAHEKIALGMKVLIREGSAAKNLQTLYRLIDQYPEMVMICTDDSHPNDLQHGHINKIVASLVAKGCNLFHTLRAASINAIEHYNLPVGCLQANDFADMVVVDNLTDFNIKHTYIDGELVFSDGRVLIHDIDEKPINNFVAEKIPTASIQLKAESTTIKVIEIINGELYTLCKCMPAKIENQYVVSDTENDVLKLVVVNRYEKQSPPAVGFIHNFGLKRGAVSSSIAHDSHNIIAVGVDDNSIASAINALMEQKGGIVVFDGENFDTLPLEFAGLMTNRNELEVAQKYDMLDNKLKQFGSSLTSPLMTLAFMSLLVIPELKLGDKGLFDGLKFENTSLFV